MLQAKQKNCSKKGSLMKKQCMTAICMVAFLIGVTGCSNSKESTKVETTGANVVTESAVEVTATSGAVTEKTIDAKLCNTITEGVYTSENGEMQMQVPKDWKTIENDKNILIVPNTEDLLTDNLHVQIADKDENFASYTIT